ncbi:energy-coupling factor transporter ATPase [Erysipelothrix larvae]|uniref:Energy-coupling factor transporter ATPase n=1 Tax=Erysipelothrix larvae TaxID=1514105 RepID=A0A0X8GZ31_9FIRM|nr:energy-coupling factor transporter ATPase [Erysipelothrix larvae]AMC93072.1 energy-coupling factor transporter ATPase [Erysipelothrix larvae]
MKQIEIKNLVFGYEEDVPVLKHVSMSIEKGQYVSIIGHNGSGKSTIAKLLIGLMEPQHGSIHIDGELLSTENVYDIRQKIAIVFQNPDNQFIGSTVRDDIAFGLENRRVDPKEMDAIIQHYAHEVNMTEYLDHEPTKLSGGQKQRVAIAGVLSMNPEVLILDEATSMLDPKGRKEVNELVHELHDVNDMTILSISHDIEEVAMSDYVFVMNEGEVVLQGTPQEVLLHFDALQEIGLDVPFSVQFYMSLKEQGIDVDSPYDLEGMVDALWQLNSNK